MKKVYLRKKAGKGNGSETSTYESEDPKSLELVKNSPGILKGVFVEFERFAKEGAGVLWDA